MVEFGISMAIVVLIGLACWRVTQRMTLKSVPADEALPYVDANRSNDLVGVTANAYVCPIQDLSGFEKNPTPACPTECGPNGYGH